MLVVSKDTAQMEQMARMGMEEAMTQAVNQIDGLLACPLRGRRKRQVALPRGCRRHPQHERPA
jgi:hypothetical protein